MINRLFVLLVFYFTFQLNAQNGTIKTYYSSGKVESRISFVNEILEGTTYWYYENGNLKAEKNYSNGKLNGIMKTYYENGLVKDETHIDNGIMNGVNKSYYKNGGLKEVREYQDGQLLSIQNIEYDSSYIAPLLEYTAGNKKNNIENNDFICSMEICPEPVGGIEEIESNIVYPQLAEQFKLEGSVMMMAIINNKGIPENIKVIKGLGLGCDEAAIEAVKRTKFVPGRNNGDEITSEVTFKLNFRLKKNANDSEKLASGNSLSAAASNSIDTTGILTQTAFISCDTEECPKPIGGIIELLKKLRYPPHAKRNNISGEVVLKAKVNEVGFVISTEIVNGLGYGCDEAAKSAIINTQFEPAKINSKEVESIIKITVPFILDKESL